MSAALQYVRVLPFHKNLLKYGLELRAPAALTDAFLKAVWRVLNSDLAEN